MPSKRSSALYKTVLTRQAQKDYLYLYKADRPLFNRIRAAILSIAEDPGQGKPLKLNLKGKWSYRVGMYRIIYSIEHGILTVYILDIGHRRDIYK